MRGRERSEEHISRVCDSGAIEVEAMQNPICEVCVSVYVYGWLCFTVQVRGRSTLCGSR